MHTSRLPLEEPCPVSDRLLGDLYQASPQGLPRLIETIPPNVRAMLATYCYRRAHLASIGLAIASTCEKSALIDFGGDFGAALFEEARHLPKEIERQDSGRRKVSLSRGALMKIVIDQDLI